MARVGVGARIQAGVLWRSAGAHLLVNVPDSALKRRNPRYRAAQYQRMDIVCAFVCVDGFQVGGVADDLIFLADAVAAVHVARLPGDVERLADIVAFDNRDHVGRKLSIIHQSADAQRRLQAQRNVGHHIGQLFLE